MTKGQNEQNDSIQADCKRCGRPTQHEVLCKHHISGSEEYVDRYGSIAKFE
jgi:hypothetical protein